MFDILITVAQKDFNKLPFVCEAIVRNVKDYHNIYYVAPVAIPDECIFTGHTGLVDREVIDFDFTRIRMANRRGWYKQQFIKLFQGVTADNYLVVDADVYINKPLVVDTAQPAFWLGKDQHHTPYFQFMHDVCGLERAYPHSFINEIMLFRRPIIQHLLAGLKMNKYEFFDACVEEINTLNEQSGFSEYELYGNYVTKTFPHLYQYRYLKTFRDRKSREWTDEEIRQHIHKYAHTDYDLISMHSWI